MGLPGFAATVLLSLGDLLTCASTAEIEKNAHRDEITNKRKWFISGFFNGFK
jgi:hypothetical protein